MTFEANIDNMLKSMNAIAKSLPIEIAKAKKNMSKEDAKKLDEAIKTIDMESKLKEFQDIPKSFESFMKKNYAG